MADSLTGHSANISSYCASFREYLKVLGKPKLTHDMLQFEQPDWRLHFQAWNTLYVYTMLLKGSVFLLLLCMHLSVTSMYEPEMWIMAGAFVLSFAVHFLLYTVLATHLAWFVVWKSYGCCGKTGYVVLAVFYLAMAFTHVSYYLVGNTSSLVNPFELLHGVFALAVLIPSIFVSLACFKLFEGVPGTSQPLMQPDEAGEPLQEVTVTGSPLEESPIEALQESSTPFQELPAESFQSAAGTPTVEVSADSWHLPGVANSPSSRELAPPSGSMQAIPESASAP